ncbi:MAG: PQQ-binding-like beta-propeller repeat protein [Mariniblastus sp.]|nr:PQQ-binding-like beta-propeller repeat protein [Mariniblastus sp.]
MEPKLNDRIITAQGPTRPRRTVSNQVGFLFVLTTLLITGSTGALAPSAAAQNWPQIMGPNRNGISENETLLRSFPEDGLKKVWSHPIGQGYSGPVVEGDRVVVFHRIRSDQWVECLSLRDGSIYWKTKLPAKYRSGGIDPDTGPKAVPIIHNGNVYLFDAAGELFCLNMADGSEIWSRSASTEFRAPSGYFGFGSTPIIVSDALIVNVGGRDAGVVAFDLKTGETQWTATDQRSSYSSPIVTNTDGKPTVMLVSRLKFFGLNPATGQVAFEFPFGDRGPTVNGAMPVAIGNKIFLTASYGIGARYLAPSTTGIRELWSDANNFESQYSTPILSQGKLFGTAGREDHRTGSFRCLDPSTQTTEWVEENFPVGHCILVNDKIVVLDHTGQLHILKANPKAFERIYQTRLFEGKSRAMPALSNGRLLARSNAINGEAELACFLIGSVE